MIRLSHAPMEGSAVKLQLSFKDNFGNYYVPTMVTYTFLALNDDKESWTVADDIYQKSLVPASTIMLTIDKLKTITGATNQRKVIVEYTAFVDGQMTDFVDEVTFEIQPKPYIPAPPAPTPVTHYVEITDIDLQIGAPTCTPLKPVFYAKANMPVNVENAEITIAVPNENDVINTDFELDSTKTKITITPVVNLERDTTYELKITGIVSALNGYQMESDFTFSFKTADSIISGNIEDAINELYDKDIELEDKIDNNTAQIEANTEAIRSIEEKGSGNEMVFFATVRPYEKVDEDTNKYYPAISDEITLKPGIYLLDEGYSSNTQLYPADYTPPQYENPDEDEALEYESIDSIKCYTVEEEMKVRMISTTDDDCYVKRYIIKLSKAITYTSLDA